MTTSQRFQWKMPFTVEGRTIQGSMRFFSRLASNLDDEDAQAMLSKLVSFFGDSLFF